MHPNTTDPDSLAQTPHLRTLPFDSIAEPKVKLLLGANVPELFSNIDVKTGNPGEPIAIKIPLGWSLLGPSLARSRTNECQVHFVAKSNAPPHETMECLWKFEFEVGTSVLDGPNSKEDRDAYEVMRNSVQLMNGHYQLPLFWKLNAVCLPNNLSLAQRRLCYLRKRLLKNEILYDEYKRTMNDYLAN